jgi:GT2 family glycosyltransferase
MNHVPVTKFGLVMPIHNASQHLPLVLADLNLGEDWDVVLVDDGSSDGSAALARELLPQARIFRIETAVGPAEARNRGVKVVKGEVILFLDSDVVASRGVVEGLANFLHGDEELSAAFGAYDDEPAVQTPVSQFRNLLHHYVHGRSKGVIPSFWSGFGAVKRDAFEAMGGFDSARYPNPSVEDIDFGSRLWNAGYKAYLEPSLQVTHLKHWTLANFVKTDILQRARPWALMILEGRAAKNILNLNGKFKTPIFLLGLFLLSLAVTLVQGQHFWVPSLLGLAYLSWNQKFYQFSARHNLAAAGVVLLALHHLCALLGASLAVGDYCSALLGQEKEVLTRRPSSANEMSEYGVAEATSSLQTHLPRCG